MTSLLSDFPTGTSREVAAFARQPARHWIAADRRPGGPARVKPAGLAGTIKLR